MELENIANCLNEVFAKYMHESRYFVMSRAHAASAMELIEKIENIIKANNPFAKAEVFACLIEFAKYLRDNYSRELANTLHIASATIYAMLGIKPNFEGDIHEKNIAILDYLQTWSLAKEVYDLINCLLHDVDISFWVNHWHKNQENLPELAYLMNLIFYFNSLYKLQSVGDKEKTIARFNELLPNTGQDAVNLDGIYLFLQTELEVNYKNQLVKRSEIGFANREINCGAIADSTWQNYLREWRTSCARTQEMHHLRSIEVIDGLDEEFKSYLIPMLQANGILMNRITVFLAKITDEFNIVPIISKHEFSGKLKTELETVVTEKFEISALIHSEDPDIKLFFSHPLIFHDKFSVKFNSLSKSMSISYFLPRLENEAFDIEEVRESFVNKRRVARNLLTFC